MRPHQRQRRDPRLHLPRSRAPTSEVHAVTLCEHPPSNTADDAAVVQPYKVVIEHQPFNTGKLPYLGGVALVLGLNIRGHGSVWTRVPGRKWGEINQSPPFMVAIVAGVAVAAAMPEVVLIIVAKARLSAVVAASR